MIHQFRDKRQIVRRKRTIRIGVVFVALVLLSAVGVLTGSSRILQYIARPIWEVKNVFLQKVNNVNYLLKTKSSLMKDNNNLIQENSNLQTAMIDYQILKDENNQLKELLGRIPTKNNFVLANILAKPSVSPYDTIIVDIGSNSNITEGEKVYVDATIPIGVVSKVYNNTSLISLYSNPGQTTEAILSTTSNASVLLTGRGGGNFDMIIPNDLIIDKGTMVVLPNIKSEVIAIVEDVISLPTDPVKKVILRSPINIQELKWVEIKKD